MAVPLLVHLVFHPASGEARQLARHVYSALNHDPNLPGLRLPTVLLPEDGSLLPPEKLALDEGEHSIVVVFADDTMVIEQ